MNLSGTYEWVLWSVVFVSLSSRFKKSIWSTPCWIFQSGLDCGRYNAHKTGVRRAKLQHSVWLSVFLEDQLVEFFWQLLDNATVNLENLNIALSRKVLDGVGGLCHSKVPRAFLVSLSVMFAYNTRDGRRCRKDTASLSRDMWFQWKSSPGLLREICTAAAFPRTLVNTNPNHAIVEWSWSENMHVPARHNFFRLLSKTPTETLE